jgi:DNA end-binding protein Ku
MLTMAKTIIGGKSINFDPEGFEDRYEMALMDLVKSKINGGEPVIAKAPERGNVINLMDALKASLDADRRPAAPSLAKPAAGAKKATAAAKPAAKPAAKKKSSGS